MREIIGEQPSVSPVGLGNSLSAIDVSVLESQGDAPGQDDAWMILNDNIAQEIMPVASEPDLGTSKANEQSSQAGGDDEVSDNKPAPQGEKCKATSLLSPGASEVDVKPNVKHNNTSSKSTKHPKKLSKLEEFSTVVAVEEVTHQKQLELTKAKIEVAGSVKIEQKKAAVAKKQMEHDLQMQAEKFRFELVKQKQELKHQHALARLTSAHVEQGQPPYPRPDDFYGGYGAGTGGGVPQANDFHQDLVLPLIPNHQGNI